MTSTEITLNVTPYACEPCFEERGQHVEALVRMVPRAVVMNGQLIGDECYCCPVCFDPKFRVKGHTAVRQKAEKPDRARPRLHIDNTKSK